jgi:hypothetical protein
LVTREWTRIDANRFRRQPGQTGSNQIKPAGRLACPEIGQSDAERGRRMAAWSNRVKPSQTAMANRLARQGDGGPEELMIREITLGLRNFGVEKS